MNRIQFEAYAILPKFPGLTAFRLRDNRAEFIDSSGIPIPYHELPTERHRELIEHCEMFCSPGDRLEIYRLPNGAIEEVVLLH